MEKLAWLAGIAAFGLATRVFAATDLAITSIEARDRARLDFTEASQGHDISVWVELENRGDDNALDVPLTCRRSTDAKSRPLAEATIRTGALAAHARRRLVVRLAASPQGGTQLFTCTVDPADLLRESDETNNTIAKTLWIQVPRSGDFEIQLTNLDPWIAQSSGHGLMRLDIKNASYRGPAEPAPSTGQAMLWQADCRLPQAPWARVRKAQNLTLYASGSVPPPGEEAETSFWVYPRGQAGGTSMRMLPPKLLMQCKLVVGLFIRGPVVHGDGELPVADWMPVQTFWSGTKTYQIPNPDSSAYVPPQDVSLVSVSGSASASANRPPKSTGNTFARFTARMTRPIASLAVNCRALKGTKELVSRTGTYTASKLTVSNAIDLGVLSADSYRIECRADPDNRIPDDNRSNNLRPASVRVYPPGVDLAIRNIDARDLSRFSYTAPSAGREIAVWVDVENTSGEDAPDLAIVCRRRVAATGPVESEARVRTGVIRYASRKTFTVRMPAVAQAATHHLWCMVDGGNYVRELDENNNIMAEPLVIEPGTPNDFRVELRDFTRWTTDPLGHRRAEFRVRNASARGAAFPPPPGSDQALLWQADCFILQMPWVRVRERENLTHYPSGVLPAPGATSGASLWLDSVNQTGMPPASSFPATLNLSCTVTTGLFIQGPVIHRGDRIPHADWMPVQIWWRGTMMVPLPNPESKRP